MEVKIEVEVEVTAWRRGDEATRRARLREGSPRARALGRDDGGKTKLM